MEARAQRGALAELLLSEVHWRGENSLRKQYQRVGNTHKTAAKIKSNAQRKNTARRTKTHRHKRRARTRAQNQKGTEGEKEPTGTRNGRELAKNVKKEKRKKSELRAFSLQTPVNPVHLGPIR